MGGKPRKNLSYRKRAGRLGGTISFSYKQFVLREVNSPILRDLTRVSCPIQARCLISYKQPLKMQKMSIKKPKNSTYALNKAISLMIPHASIFHHTTFPGLVFCDKIKT